MRSSSRSRVVTVGALLLSSSLLACVASSGDGSEAVGATGAAVSSSSPYVKLRFAQAEQTAGSAGVENLVATGFIEVANVAYEKQVVVHYRIGAQTQKPLAIVAIGGSLILAVVARIIQAPLLYLTHSWLERRKPPPSNPGFAEVV